ncbi:MAG TPA: FemAB family XrtA/PEP-CTERM system-associated protein [Casimicrobiaceae bacterium]|nr:FemAB family XrtA/PEP-CTERM system-associated protein [Casimicrobiaceae bacterium]
MNSVATADSLRPAAAAAPIGVRALGPGDAPRWDAFVMGCPDATFFHRSAWKDILESCFGHRTHYLLAERGGEVVGVLPLAEVKSLLFGHALVSLPFCAYGGAAAVESAAVAALHAAARELGAGLGVEHLELRDRVVREPDWPRQELYVTFRGPILPDAEANLAAIPRKQRAMVRKGIAARLSSRVDDDVETFFALYADNMHRQGTPPLPKRYFAALRRAFGDDCETLTILAPGGEAVSGVLSFYFRDEVLPYYAGDVAAARDLAANDFKYWELMCRAGGRGSRVFDYGRSKRGTGAFEFKRHWGFDPAPLAYEYCLYRRDSIPEHNPLNPKYRLLIGLWRRLPVAVANALGPHVVRGLG